MRAHGEPAMVPCRSCGAPVVFVRTKTGKLAPMDVDAQTGAVTDVSHFATCTDPKRWRKRGPAAEGGRR